MGAREAGDGAAGRSVHRPRKAPEAASAARPGAPSGLRTGAERRREAIAQLIDTRRISTQDELLAALRDGGFHSTQATLSRDLARLGARRRSEPGGGTRYEIAGDRRDGADTLGRLVASISCNGSLVVVRTHPGSAQAIARAVDLARLSGSLGTIAGDDTVFVAPVREGRGRALADEVRRLFGVA